MRSVRGLGFGINHYSECTSNLGTGESWKKHEHLISKKGKREVEQKSYAVVLIRPASIADRCIDSCRQALPRQQPPMILGRDAFSQYKSHLCELQAEGVKPNLTVP
jgi:hypothetical protein